MVLFLFSMGGARSELVDIVFGRWMDGSRACLWTRQGKSHHRKMISLCVCVCPCPPHPDPSPPRHKPQPPAPEPTGACVKYNPNPFETPLKPPTPTAPRPPHISLPSPLQSHRNPRFSIVPCPRATHRPTEAAAAEPAMARRVAPTTGARIAPLAFKETRRAGLLCMMWH